MNVLENEMPSDLLIDSERKILYQLFCEIFYEPISKGQLEYFKTNINEDWIFAIKEAYPAFYHFFNKVEEVEVDILYNELKQEYQSICYIFNADGRVQAPIWESYYTSADHSLFSNATYILRNKLHEFNLQYEQENSHPEDHLAVELDFLYYLIDFTNMAYHNKDYASYEKGVYTQYWLLKDHLLKWVPLFVKKIELANKESIYFSLSKLLLEILKEDLQWIKILKGGIEND